MAVFGFRNVGMKFLSIVVAAAMWFAISGQQMVERALRVPLEYTNMPTHLETSGDTPNVVDIRVRGSSAALSRIAPGELVAVLDVRSARPGRRLFHLSGADVRAPFGIEVVQVTPANVTIDFAPSSSKVVPVVPSVEGEPAEGFQIGTITADPATVDVAGPEDALKRLTRAITEPISVAGARAAVQESVNVGVADPALRLRKPRSATVVVEITPVPVERSIGPVTVTVRGERVSAAAVRPSHVSVTVRGARDSLAALAPEDVQASVDLSGLKTGRHQVPVRVVVPSQIAVVEVNPAQVQATVR
jgi:hypothetical protein